MHSANYHNSQSHLLHQEFFKNYNSITLIPIGNFQEFHCHLLFWHYWLSVKPGQSSDLQNSCCFSRISHLLHQEFFRNYNSINWISIGIFQGFHCHLLLWHYWLSVKPGQSSDLQNSCSSSRISVGILLRKSSWCSLTFLNFRALSRVP